MCRLTSELFGNVGSERRKTYTKACDKFYFLEGDDHKKNICRGFLGQINMILEGWIDKIIYI